MKIKWTLHQKKRQFLIVFYLLLLIISNLLSVYQQDNRSVAPDQSSIAVPQVGGRPQAQKVTIAYWDQSTTTGAESPVLLFLHGSPHFHQLYQPLVTRLAVNYRVILPELPGFGNSTRKIPDYSIKAQAEYMRQFLNQLNIHQVHLVAYSMGSGVALHLAQQQPQRILSVTMLSAIGVQELELLGDYYLNHAIHGAQVGLIWFLSKAIPHMGLLDDFPINLSYARNFYDSDQRPLRQFLQALPMPLLILHGNSDNLVPLATANEHYRIVPQSKIIIYDDDHLMIRHRADELSRDITSFITSVKDDKARSRNLADPARVVAANEMLTSVEFTPATGITLFIFMILIALATLVSEDLTCIGAGLIAARGIIGVVPAVVAAFAGIFIGDLLVYLAGKWLGRPAISRVPFKWFITESDITKSSRWFAVKGPMIILLSRFIPGSRLPTYFSAGVLGASIRMFVFYFFIAAAVWTPLLVGLSVVIGNQVLQYFFAYQKYALFILLGTVILIRLLAKLIVALFSFKGRRLLLASFQRKIRWEFWPPYVFYVPILFYVLYLGFRYRCFTLFTAANPAIPAGGFIGESKYQILQQLRNCRHYIARYRLIEHQLPMNQQILQVKNFISEMQIAYPVVLKPDVGQRGTGVSIIKSETEVENYFTTVKVDTIVQEYAPGAEYGVFYFRHPGAISGRIFAITDKRMLQLTGDGKSTLEQLILMDDRAVCLAPLHLKQHKNNLFKVPAIGEKVNLVELGTHCRGAVFFDGRHIHTPQLEKVIDKISQGFEGFYFGRYDIRTPAVEDFKKGRNFKIVELNGVTSEATNIYDPRNSLLAAYRVLMQQWNIAFEIGAGNRQRGVKTVSPWKLLGLLIKRQN